MIGHWALLAAIALVSVCSCQQSEDYRTEYVADKEYLNKSKLVYDVLYHVNQPSLKSELHKVGQEYDLKSNIDSYTDKSAVEYFIRHERYGLMPHDAIYSVYYHSDETLAVFKVLYAAKDFDTFYKTAMYLRNRVNHDLFTYAFYLAVIRRPDTEYIRLPPLYEISPYLFYNNELLDQAHHVEYFGKKEESKSGRQTYVLPYNYSGHYLNDEYDYNYENLLNYLTEDIGFNEYYFYFRNEYPFLLNSEEFNLYDKYRGEEYLFGHRQILARYNLERLVNNLGRVEHIDYHIPFYPGFYPTMSYPNGLPFPMRPWDSKFPKNKLHDISFAMQYEGRIADAVDSGFVLNKDGEQVHIYTPEGLNILGNLIEGNADSINTRYYDNVDKLMRHILGFNFEPTSRYQSHPSALEQFATSLRDPAFYRIYFKILHYLFKYQENQGPYKLKEIHFPDLEIKSVKVDKLVTFFDAYDSSISNGLIASTAEVADNIVIKARQNRLNHEPFSINITVNAKEDTKASVRIFLGPKYDVHNREIEFNAYAYDYYYQIDNFITDLKAGSNEIVRDHVDYTIEDNESTEEYYDRVVAALESGVEFKYQKRIAGFPDRLVLPKGKADGVPLQLFVHVAKVEGEPTLYKSRVFGNSYVDNRSFGYPLDRPIIDHDFLAPNFYFKEVSIYHRN